MTTRHAPSTRLRQPRPSSARTALVLLALGALIALVAAPAASALEWGAHQTLSASGEVTSNEPSTAMDAGGDAVAGWASVTGPYFECPCAVRVATRGAGQAFGAPVTLATSAEEDGAENIDDVHVAMDSAGEAVAVWDAGHPVPLDMITGQSHDVYASVRPAGGSFGVPQLLSVEGTDSDGGGAPELTMDSAGDITVAWISGLGWFKNDPEPRLQVVKRPAGGAFSAPQELWGTGSEGPLAFKLATSPDGHTAIALTHRGPAGCSPTPCNPYGNGAHEVIEVATAAHGGAFGSPAAVSPVVTTSTTPDEGPFVEVGGVAIDDGGDVVASYEEAGDGSFFTGPRSDEFVTRDAGGSFSSPTSLDALGRANAGPVAIDPAGESTVTWRDENGDEAAWRAHGASFGSTQALADTEAWLPSLAEGSNLASGNGDVLAVMPIEGGSNTRIAAALRPAGGSFETPATVEQVPAGSEPSEPVGAIDAAGDSAVLVWANAPAIVGGPGTIRAALTGPATGGEEHAAPSGPGPGPGDAKTGPSKPTPPPIKTRAKKCKKGFKKKKVHGKTRCVKVKKHTHGHKRH